MADELDPILEARLRGVLLEDAASVPFTLRADTVRRVQVERRRARNMQRLTLMSAAAVVVVVIAGTFFTLNLRNSSNVATSPSPSASAEPSAVASPVTSAVTPVSPEPSTTPAATTAASANPSPAVACQPAPKGQKVPPAVSLYQGENELGVGNYYTFSWGTTSSDGVPVIGDHILTAGEGTGLTARIAGDVCAVSWDVVYGTGTSGNVGYQKVGQLAQQQNPNGDPAAASQNRIPLADLPAGDWVVDVLVHFADGDGATLFLVHVDGAGAPTAQPAPSMPALNRGEMELTTLNVNAGLPAATWSGARPSRTDAYRVQVVCSGDGNLVITVDGVVGTWGCGAIGLEEFTVGPDPKASITASATSSATASIRLAAYDMAKASLKVVPPALVLSGPDFTAGDTVSVKGVPGCGWSWQPASGQGGFVEDCGPSWLAVASPLHQRHGTTVTLSLPAGWTIYGASASIANNADILPGRSPSSQPLDVTSKGGTWTFTVPAAGDWGVVISVSLAHNGDKLQLPYYSRVIVTP